MLVWAISRYIIVVHYKSYHIIVHSNNITTECIHVDFEYCKHEHVETTTCCTGTVDCSLLFIFNDSKHISNTA